MSVNNKTVAKAMRWAGRIIALPFIAFFFLFGLGYFVETLTTQGLQNAIGGVYNFLGEVTIVLALVGVIISWWWLLPAGILLIFAYLLGAISSGLDAIYHVGYFNWSQFRDSWSITGIIYLVSGMLFLLSWWLTKSNSR